MRPTFLIDDKCTLVSAMIRKDQKHGLHVGTVVELTADYHNDYGVVPKGTKGFVSYVDEATGSVELLMEGIEPALTLWENLMILVPFETDDLTDILVCALKHTQEKLNSGNVSHLRTGTD